MTVNKVQSWSRTMTQLSVNNKHGPENEYPSYMDIKLPKYYMAVMFKNVLIQENVLMFRSPCLQFQDPRHRVISSVEHTVATTEGRPLYPNYWFGTGADKTPVTWLALDTFSSLSDPNLVACEYHFVKDPMHDHHIETLSALLGPFFGNSRRLILPTEYPRQVINVAVIV